MGGYILVGAVCLMAGVFLGCLIMSLMIVSKNNEYHTEEFEVRESKADADR